MSRPTLRLEPVMGTMFRIEVAGAPVAPAVLDDAVALAHRCDELFSTYRADSPVSRLSRGELRLADCPPEVAEVAELCATARRLTGGWFDPAFAGGFDPTGLVKGWSVERVHDLLRGAGSTAHTVNGGGDVRVFGGPRPGQPWRVGVTDPLRPDRVLAVVSGADLAVASSGGYERGCHVLDPFTGEPATGLAGVTVVGPDLAMADAWATALLAMGSTAADRLRDRDDVTALLVTDDGRCWHTPGFPGRLVGP